MSKEILHKAKRMDTNEWVEGYYVKLKLTGTSYILPGDAEVEPCKKGVLLFKKYEVDPKTICQYTGLTDKNGGKIFEGDIISFSHSRIKKEEDELSFMPEYEEYNRNYAVEFVNTYYTYGLRARNKTIHFKLSQSTINTHNAKVIGNIFDNLELLRGA